MNKRIFLRFLLFNSLLLLSVPINLFAALDAPEANPVSFALANLTSFDKYLFLEASSSRHIFVAAGAARLYQMPEIQPFALRAAAPLFKGLVGFRGAGLRSGSYSETTAALSYERQFQRSLTGMMEMQALQVAIENYGSALSSQLNARLTYQARSTLAIAFGATNLTSSTFGEGAYPLPQRLAAGISVAAQQAWHFFLEVEHERARAITTRFASGFSPIPSITLLAGLQSDPRVVSAGASVLIRFVRATASFQYHPDLGLSQCVGLTVAF